MLKIKVLSVWLFESDLQLKLVVIFQHRPIAFTHFTLNLKKKKGFFASLSLWLVFLLNATKQMKGKSAAPEGCVELGNKHTHLKNNN